MAFGSQIRFSTFVLQDSDNRFIKEIQIIVPQSFCVLRVSTSHDVARKKRSEQICFGEMYHSSKSKKVSGSPLTNIPYRLPVGNLTSKDIAACLNAIPSLNLSNS